MKNYQDFLSSKATLFRGSGFEPTFLPDFLHDFQRDCVSWACRRGSACLFHECGLGKTIQQLVWSENVVRHTSGRVIILAPLAVSTQTVAEGARFGIDARYLRADDGQPGIVVTNYEMMSRFNPADFTGVVLDESSILKAHDGKTRTAILEEFAETPFRLACTATPAPNDHIELGNHAEFMGAMTRAEMLAMFFVHDGGSTQNWRLKGHAREAFWEWMATWAVMLKSPADLGYDGSAFELPELTTHHHVLELADPLPGQLFMDTAKTLNDQRAAARASLAERTKLTADMVNASDEPWIVWCNLNDESAALAASIPDAVEVKGADSLEVKEARLIAFMDGKARVLVSKPRIAGWGLNLQFCNHVAFCGLSHSWEAYYQAIRRCWRFGQKRPVDVHVIVSDAELEILDNIERKEKEAEVMTEEMAARISTHTDLKTAEPIARSEYEEDAESGEGWKIMLGDCVSRVAEIETDSIHYTVFSPPFASLYTYSDSLRDMGNCKTHGEFAEHFRYLCGELLRVTMPGRLLSFHCMNLPTSKARDGVIGLRDFRGELIEMFSAAGWIYHSEVCIWKDPVTAMQRTKALGLLHKQVKKDSCMSRQGIADYLVTMRKPGDNPERVTHTNESFPVRLWQNYASPIWTDINASDTLQFRNAREHDDERHICPLQLEVIRRAIKLWTNEGDTVMSPFAGIGSEGYVAIEQGREFLGMELKRSYFDVGCENLRRAVAETKQPNLFDYAESE